MATPVNILIVTDADGAFDQSTPHRFGLTTLIDALKSNVQDGMSYKITTAHRYPKDTYSQAASADFDAFVFDSTFTVSKFDELWLFGIASSDPTGHYLDPPGFELKKEELEIIQTFMEQGGGVFATGDHDDLGRDLCGFIPRVRSMRRWTFDYVQAGNDYSGYQEDSGFSPPVMGVFRHSTINKAANGRYEFDNQSDDVPQTIEPVISQLITGPPVASIITSFPHPLLCGMDGVIGVLPDHMHEGQCQIPTLSGTYSSKGIQSPEYPAYLGSPLSPQVVAWENIIGRSASGPDDPGKGANSDDNEDLESDRAACIVAWDGQLVSQGRVVVDSTFHHFVDVNFLGVGVDIKHTWTADETAKTLGLAHSTSTEGKTAFKRIRQYFRNIARWLAPTAKQISFQMGWIRSSAFDPRISKTIGTAHGLDGKVRFGGGMHSIMNNFIPACAAMEVSSTGVPDPLSIILGKWYILKTLPDPPPNLNWRNLPFNVGILSQFTLGAAGVVANRELRKRPSLPDSELLPMVHSAVRTGVEAFMKAQVEGLRANALLAEKILSSIR